MENFDTKLAELFAKLGESKIMVLATGDGERISARSMSVVIYNHKLYFQTDSSFLKCQQMQSNCNVALCCDNISFEGKCSLLGNPLDNENFATLYEKCHKGSYDAYSHLPTEVLFEVNPTLIKLWTYENSVPYLESYDCEKFVYKKERQGIN